MFDKMLVIQAIMRSEMLDDKTCDLCMLLDGIMLRADDPLWDGELGQYAHPYCRAIWVPILDTGVLEPTPAVDIPDVFKSGVAMHLIDDWEDMPMPTKGVDKLKVGEMTADDLMPLLEPYEVYAGLLIGAGEE